MDWIATNVVVAIVKTMNLVTMSVEDVLMDVRMGTWTNIVIAVRNIHDYFRMIFYTVNCLFLLNLNLFEDYSLQSRVVWEKLYFSMSSKLQWDM